MADSTTIGRTTAVTGRIEGDEDLFVLGRVDGSIDIDQSLTIGPEAFVTGDIKARQVVIQGSVQGDIIARERVVLAESARAIATIDAPAVEMASGARLQGEVSIGTDGPVSISTDSPTTTPRSTTRTAPPTTPPRSTSGQAGRTATARSASTTTTTVVEETSEATEEAATDAGDADESDTAVDEETFEQYRQDFTVKELREKLREQDLQVSGTKDELIERLLTAEA